MLRRLFYLWYLRRCPDCGDRWIEHVKAVREHGFCGNAAVYGIWQKKEGA